MAMKATFQGAAAQPTGVTPLMTAAAHARIDEAKDLLVQGADINVVDSRGWNALMYAIWNRHFDTVKFLLENGSSYTKPNNNGTTPEKLAAKRGCPDISHYIRIEWPKLHCQRFIDSYNMELKRNIPVNRRLKIPKAA